MSSFEIVVLWSDGLFFALMVTALAFGFMAIRFEPLREAWRAVGMSRSGMAAATVLLVFVLIGLLDSLHYRPVLAGRNDKAPTYSVEVLSALDALLMPLKARKEKTYSAPLDMRSFDKETLESGQRDFPRLRYGGADLADPAAWGSDLRNRLLLGLAAGLLVWIALLTLCKATTRGSAVAWDAVLAVLLVLCVVAGPAVALAREYHVLGTDKVGQDVLYLSLKAIRTGLLLGTLTTLIMLPAALFFGIVAGYVGGWVDDAIQYLYTTLSSIPDVLLIAAAVLMMQVVIDTHPNWFPSAAQRADARFLSLCVILGVTSWTSLCRLLRAETLKLRELEFIQAAQAIGASRAAVMLRHVLPNVMHIVLITLVLNFSGLVLAEAVLSYIGIGVDPNTISFGTMINAARMELAREPMVWWPLISAFVFMFTLVLAANVFADAVRDAFDPRSAR